MLTAEIIPRDEQGLHSRVVTQALAVPVGQSSESPHAHTVGEIEPLDMAGAYPIFVAIPEHWQLFDIGYLGRRIACGFLRRLVIFYQDGEVHLRLESKGYVHPVGCEAIGGQLEAASANR